MNISFLKFKSISTGLFFLLLVFVLSSCDKSELIYPEESYDEQTSVYTETQDITEHVFANLKLTDIHKDLELVDYRVTLKSWEIHGELFIDAGVVIEFIEDAEVIVQNEGAISTSMFDKIRLTGKEKTAGYWKGLHVKENGKISLCKTSIEYAGGSPIIDGMPSAAINVEGILHLFKSEITHSAGYGVRTSSTAMLQSIRGTVFTNTAKAAISTTADQMHAIGTRLSFANNGHNGVLVRSSILETGPCPGPWETLEGTATYLIENEDNTTPAEILVTSNWEINPGVHIQFGEGASIRVKADAGKITAIGTTERPITFEGKEVQSGFWIGIFLEEGRETSTMDHVSIKHAGGQVFDNQLSLPIGAIRVHEATLQISNSTISDSDGCAFASQEATAVQQSNNTFSNLTGGEFCNQ